MSYGVVYTVTAPIEIYDAVHAEVGQQPADGLVMHLAREVDGGFQVIEVWESKEQHDRFGTDVLAPIIGRLTGGDAPPEPPAFEEFDVRTLWVPAAGIG